MKFTLRQLQVFCAIAHHESVSRAGEELAMSQSACSGALKELEQLYSLRLFDRIGKKLRINQQGMALRAKAEALLGQAKELEESLSGGSTIHQLRLGATLTIGEALAGQLIRDFSMGEKKQADTHKTHIILEVANTQTIAKHLSQFDFDIGLIEGEINAPDLDLLPWKNDELVCFCHPKHPLANQPYWSDKLLTQSDWILREQGSGTRQTFDRAMSDLQQKLNIRLELQNTEAIKQAVISGLGISCLSILSLEKEFQAKTLVPIRLKKRSFKRRFYIVLHKDKYRDRNIRRWLELCQIQDN